jgi:hypothetical protein
VDTGDVYVVTVFSEETTEVDRVMAVPRNFVFRENIAHSTLIVIGVVVVPQRRVDISVIMAGRPIIIAIIAISGFVTGVIGWIGIYVGFVWVDPVPAPPRIPPPWRGEVADKDDFVEMLEAMKPIISIKVSVVKRLKRRRPKAEFIIGARCIGIRAIESGVKAPRIPIRDIELPCPLICAVAVEAAKTHATTQPRRTNFLQFIAL